MLELRHLRYFVAVAEERNFSRAAERLHMAQSPLSAAIRQLEQEVGAELLARSSRGVTLNPAGEVMLERARRILESVEGALAAARRTAAGELGTLRIGFSWSARFATLPMLARTFAERYPDITLITQEMWNADIPPALRSGTIDLAISLCPERDGELNYQLLRRERVVALLPAAHRLAANRPVNLAELADEEFVMFPRDLAPRLHDAILAICRRAGFDPRVSRRAFHSAGDTGTLAAATAVALAPASVEGGIPGVNAVPLFDDDAWLETFIVCPERALSAAAARFREHAHDVLAPPVGDSSR
ncbi:MAG: LysR family transcriptional regulator [Solirubrobacterales bacterium]|nr:LysR family transcriptional regulator [Solirubrobacterales bacterium]